MFEAESVVLPRVTLPQQTSSTEFASSIAFQKRSVELLGMLARVGIKVPDEVSLVGYDNLPEGQGMHPALTTIDGAIDQQLQAALTLLTQPVPTQSHMAKFTPTPDLP